MAEPTNQELLSAISLLVGQIGGLASAEQVEHIGRKLDKLEAKFDVLEAKVDGLEAKFDGFNELVAQGFASLGVRETRRAGTGDD